MQTVQLDNMRYSQCFQWVPFFLLNSWPSALSNGPSTKLCDTRDSLLGSEEGRGIPALGVVLDRLARGNWSENTVLPQEKYCLHLIPSWASLSENGENLYKGFASKGKE